MSWGWNAICVGLAGALMLATGAGCDPERAPTGPEDAERQASVDTPDALVAARPKKGAVIGGERVSRVLTWPDATRIDEGTRDKLSAQARDATLRSEVPVLVPVEGAEVGELYTGDRWYAYTTRIDGDEKGVTISVQGSAAARIHPGIHHEDPTYEIRSDSGVEGGFISQNEAIWAVSWIEHGAAYSLELECDDPTMAACADTDRVLELVEGMVFVGGEEVR